MTSEGSGIYDAFDQVRGVCAETALLLRTAESQLHRHGWEAYKNSAAAAGGSMSLDAPRRWIPEYVHRFFLHHSHPTLAVYVAVVFECEDATPIMNEPLITAGWLRMRDRSVRDNWSYDWSRFHLYAPRRVDDGRLIEFNPPDNWSQRVREHLDRAGTLALPLVRVTNAPALEELVIRPLLSST